MELSSKKRIPLALKREAQCPISEEHEQPYWVYYQLELKEVNGSAERTDDFREDPLVSSGSATLADYSGSGYDRGHLAPAADMKENETEMSESFFMSNMSPQKTEFNRYIWKYIEIRVREFCKKWGTLHVVTGPVLKDGLPTIGDNGVAVPEAFYKVIHSETLDTTVAYLVPHERSYELPKSFEVSVDSVESVTGVRFRF